MTNIDTFKDFDALAVQMSVHDLLSESEFLMHTPVEQLGPELNDLELVHARLSKVIARICNGKAV